MSSKFSMPTVVIAALLAFAHGSISTAEVYKTSKGQVIVTGLTAKQNYPVKVVNTKSKSKNLKDKTANTCGEVTVDNAATYKSLVVGTETIDPATLTVKEHLRCKAKKAAVTTATTKKKTVNTSTTSTIIPPGIMTTPTTVPAVK
jgi:predicted peptidase